MSPQTSHPSSPRSEDYFTQVPDVGDIADSKAFDRALRGQDPNVDTPRGCGTPAGSPNRTPRGVARTGTVAAVGNNSHYGSSDEDSSSSDSERPMDDRDGGNTALEGPTAAVASMAPDEKAKERPEDDDTTIVRPPDRMQSCTDPPRQGAGLELSPELWPRQLRLAHLPVRNHQPLIRLSRLPYMHGSAEWRRPRASLARRQTVCPRSHAKGAIFPPDTRGYSN